ERITEVLQLDTRLPAIESVGYLTGADSALLDPQRREALAHARDTGGFAASAPIRAQTHPEQQPLVHVYLIWTPPVWQSNFCNVAGRERLQSYIRPVGAVADKPLAGPDGYLQGRSSSPLRAWLAPGSTHHSA